MHYTHPSLNSDLDKKNGRVQWDDDIAEYKLKDGLYEMFFKFFRRQMKTWIPLRDTFAFERKLFHISAL